MARRRPHGRSQLRPPGPSASAARFAGERRRPGATVRTCSPAASVAPNTSPLSPSWEAPPSGAPSPADTASAFAAALDAGVNHLDVAPQLRAGPGVARARSSRPCATACSWRARPCVTTPAGVRAQLEESLTLLRCDVLRPLPDARRDRSGRARRRGRRRGGAIMAARDEGLCRFVGITGHNLTTPAAQLEALRRYDLDTVMFPVNPRLWADLAYRRDAEALLAEAEARDVGVMAIKAVAARPVGRAPSHRHHVVRGLHGRGGDRARRALRAQHPRRATPCARRAIPGWPATAIAAAGRFEPMAGDERAAAMAATAAEEHIFPMPVGLTVPAPVTVPVGHGNRHRWIGPGSMPAAVGHRPRTCSRGTRPSATMSSSMGSTRRMCSSVSTTSTRRRQMPRTSAGCGPCSQVALGARSPRWPG